MIKHLLAPALIAVSLFSATANAELVERDWNNEGDGLITLDTVSGKKWLDLTVTDEMSINSVSELLSTTYAGWDLATQSDIDELMEGYFERSLNPKTTGPAGQTNTALRTGWQNLFGITGDAGKSYGLFVDDVGGIAMAGTRNLSNHLYLGYRRSGSDLDYSVATDGVFLVSTGYVTLTEKSNIQNADVPLVALGAPLLIFGVMGLKRRRFK
tara:strand:+ start:2597 stop:3232 length:636 start_codon:yes stop_codon:yes gene_type:complete